MSVRFGLLALAVLCAGATECRWDDGLGEEEDVAFETLEYNDGADVKGSASGVDRHLLTVVRDVNAFGELWAEHSLGFAPQPAQPDVAFGTDMVIGAFMGERPTGGYSIEIEDVRENDEFIVVEVEMETPGDNCDVTQAVTQPHHMIVLADSEKLVQFNESTVEAPACE